MDEADVDAGQRRPFGVLGGGPHHLAEGRVLDRRIGGAEHDDRCGKHQRPLLGDDDRAELDDVVGERAVEIFRIVAEAELRRMGDQQRHAQARQQDRELVLAPQRPEEQRVDGDTQSTDRDRRQDDAGQIAETQHRHAVIGQERAQHVEFAMREIDDAQHAEHQRQPGRNQDVVHPVDEAVGELLAEKRPVHGGLSTRRTGPAAGAAGTMPPQERRCRSGLSAR